MNYEAERAMNQKRLRMEGEPGHGVVQGNGLPLNYIGKCYLCSKQRFYKTTSLRSLARVVIAQTLKRALLM